MTFRDLLQNLSEHENVDTDIDTDLEQDIIDAETELKAKKLENDLKARYRGKYRDVIIDIEDHYGKFNRMGKKKQALIVKKYLGEK